MLKVTFVASCLLATGLGASDGQKLDSTDFSADTQMYVYQSSSRPVVILTGVDTNNSIYCFTPTRTFETTAWTDADSFVIDSNTEVVFTNTQWVYGSVDGDYYRMASPDTAQASEVAGNLDYLAWTVSKFPVEEKEFALWLNMTGYTRVNTAAGSGFAVEFELEQCTSSYPSLVNVARRRLADGDEAAVGAQEIGLESASDEGNAAVTASMAASATTGMAYLYVPYSAAQAWTSLSVGLTLEIEDEGVAVFHQVWLSAVFALFGVLFVV